MVYNHKYADYVPYTESINQVWTDDAWTFERDCTDLRILVVAIRYQLPDPNNEPATYGLVEVLKRRDT